MPRVRLFGIKKQPRNGTMYKMVRTNANDVDIPEQKVVDYLELVEMPTPSSPLANKFRLFATDSNGVPFSVDFSSAFGGSGQTQLCVLFPTGATAVLSVEP